MNVVDRRLLALGECGSEAAGLEARPDSEATGPEGGLDCERLRW